MILPSGNRKAQIAQGSDHCQQHVDMFAAVDADTLNKLAAIGDDPALGGEAAPPDPQLAKGLQQALQPKPPAASPVGPPMPNAKSIAPAGTPGHGGGELAAQPIAADPMAEGQNPNTKNQAFMDQSAKITQFVTSNNMDVYNHEAVDDKGTYRLEIGPLDGYAMPNVNYDVKVRNIIQLLDNMGAEIKGTKKNRGSQGMSSWTITYVFNPNPKVMKGNRR